MIYIAWFILCFTILQLLVAITNIIFYSKLKPGKLSEIPLVSVLIPARNEEGNIRNILNDILHQDYSDIEVIVFNDNSSDRTADIVQEFTSVDKRIRLVNSETLPAGWLGKNWACHSLSKLAGGKYLLFLDADVRISNSLIINAVSYAKKYNLSLISIFPKQIIATIGEKLTVPVMNYILLSLLPLILVRKSPLSSLAAANGQFMLFNSMAYKLLQPHEKMKRNMVEDIEIARYFKKEKQDIACLTGDDTIRCRMYNGFSEAVNGFSKNVFTFFGNTAILALLFWCVTTFGFLFILLKLSSALFLTYLIIIISLRTIISVISEQSVVDNLLFLIPQQISLGLFIYYAFLNKNIKSYKWKGRDIK